MRILVVCDNLIPPVVHSSGVKNILGLHRKLSEDGIRFHALTLLDKRSDPGRGPQTVYREHDSDDVIFTVTPWMAGYERLGQIVSRFRYLHRAWRLWRRYQYDIIHFYSSTPLMMNLAGFLKKITGAKTVVSLCTHNRNRHRHKRMVFIRPDALILPDQKTTYDPSFFRGHTHVIPVPIDDRFFNDFRQDWPENHNGHGIVQVLYLGLLKKEKGIAEFLAVMPDVMESRSQVHTAVVTAPFRKESFTGTAYRKDLQGLSAQYPGRTSFIDALVDPVEVIAQSDIFVYPLTTMHGTLSNPATLIEAMAMGKAVVAPDLAELRELLVNDVNCQQYKPGDRQGMERALVRLIDNRDLRQRLGDSARKQVSAYRREPVSQALISLYSQLNYMGASA